MIVPLAHDHIGTSMLQGMQPCVEAFPGHEVVMAAEFGDAAGIENNDLVGLSDG